MQRIAQAARTMLTDRLLPFWQALRDEEHGGNYDYMDFDLRLDRQAEKGASSTAASSGSSPRPP